MKRAILHLGTHKTGTTSIQHFLRDHLGEPAYPHWPGLNANHSLLAHAVARPGRLVDRISPRYAEAMVAIADKVREDLDRADDLVVFSGESLSLLRYEDEIERLVALFDGWSLEAVMYERRPEDFLRAYLFTIRLLGSEPSEDPESIHYIAADSWLVDCSERLDIWGRFAQVTHIDFDEVVARDGSVIPSFAALVGLEPVEYRLNVTDDLKAQRRDAVRLDRQQRSP